MQWVVSLELPGVCVWKDFIFLSFIFSIIYILSAWRGFMQLVVSLELGGECVWKGFIFYLYLLSFFFFFFILLSFVFLSFICVEKFYAMGCVT